MSDVPQGLGVAQGISAQPESNPLVNGSEFGLPQDFRNFRLPGKNYLQKFFRRSLDIAKHVHDFENFPRKILRFVDDQQRCLSHLVALKQPLLKCPQSQRLVHGFVLNPKITQHIIQKLRSFHAGIENKCRGRDFVVDLLDQLPKQQGLPCSHFTNQKNQAVARS
jgi:hypothetical protein